MTDDAPRALWAKTPASLIFDGGWTLADHRVYELLDFRAGRRGWWRTTQKVIADDLDLGQRTVKRAVAHLRRGGLIQTERHGALDGEITYRIVARLPREVAIPLDPEGPPVALPITQEGPSVSTGGASSGPSDRRTSFSGSPQTSTTEESPQSRRNRERQDLAEQQREQRGA